MVEYEVDNKGNLIAFIEFWIVNKDGKLQDDGEYTFVNEMYINPEYRNKKTITRLVRKIMDRAPWTKYGYYERRKYNNRIKMFSREKWDRRTKRGG